MYRNLLKTFLTKEELMSRNKYAPEGVKYCNFLCQDFRKSDEFSGQKVYCNDCRNKLNIAENQIQEGQITEEEFKNNPEIINGIDIVIDSFKVCTTCKENKNIDQFNNGKNNCKACLSIKNSERNNEGLEILYENILKLKENSVKLENYVLTIPKDKLVKVISHFQIGRKSTDTKDRMVHNVVEHFKKQMNPMLCSGGCGFTLKTEFSICKNCEKKNEKPRAVSKMVSFEDNLEEIVENLKEIRREDDALYNREQCYKIAKHLGLKINQKTKKDECVKLINEALLKREEDKKSLLIFEEREEPKQELDLNGILVFAREDGYINATLLCKAGKKKFNDWHRIERTIEFIKELSRSAGIPADLLIDIVNTGPNEKRGTWVHPRVAVNIAQWISPSFDVKVSGWVHELSVCGQVRIGFEKTDKELLELQKIIKDQQELIKSQEKRHKKLLYRRNYHKLKKGPCFYIISNKESSVLQYKIGIAGTGDDLDINDRLSQHRTACPGLKLEYLIYTKDNYLIEEGMKLRYHDHLQPYLNHEWIYDIKLQHIIDSVKTSLDFHNIHFEYETELDKYNEE